MASGTLGLTALVLALAYMATAPSSLRASAPAPMQTGVDANRTEIGGDVRPEISATEDLGAVADSKPLENMAVMLRRPPDASAALDQLVAAQIAPASPSYHQWLDPIDLGQNYGLAASDIAALPNWLAVQGFEVGGLRRNGIFLDFSSTADQVRAAFHTARHQIVVDGETHVANFELPSIPAALAPALIGIVKLNDFGPRSQASMSAAAACASSHSCEWVTPANLARIYAMEPAFRADLLGKGQRTTPAAGWVIITVASPSSCVLDGKTLENGTSATFYSSATVPFGTLCSALAQSRTCTNGVLSGDASYSHASCTVGTAPAPTVSITAPMGGATVSGIQTIRTTASDTGGTITGVEFMLDGANLGTVDTAPYWISWNTISTTNGTHTISAVLRDTRGNMATSTVSVIVSNTSRTLSTTVTPEEFGAVGNCVADDTEALIAMRDQLLATQDANPTHTVILTMNFGNHKCYKYSDPRWTYGLENLTIHGNGSSFENYAPYGYPFVSNGGGFSMTPLDDSTSTISTKQQTNAHDYLIQSGSPGATSVYVKTPADAADFTANAWALVFGYSQQIGGYPPNPRYFDYLKIVSADPETGKITLDRPLTHEYSDSYPEVSASDPICNANGNSIINCEGGRARIMLLSVGGDPFVNYLYMENMTFLDNPNARRPTDGPGPNDPGFKSHNYLLVANVYHAVLNNITASTFVPSMDYEVDVSNSHFWGGEIDKIIHKVNFTNTIFDGTGNPPYTPSHPFAPIGLGECTGADIVTYTGGELHELLCDPRQLTIKGTTFNATDLPKNYGVIGLSVQWPTSASITDSIFNGSPGAYQPIGPGPTYKMTLLVDDSTTTAAATVFGHPNQVIIKRAMVYKSTPGVIFMRCTQPHGAIGLIKAGTTKEELGTITSITGDGGSGAILTINIAGTIANGDTLTCHPVQSLQASGNTYNNFAPTVSLSAPANSATPTVHPTVSGTVTIAADTTNPIGVTIPVTSVQFKVDGKNLGAPLTTAPYSISWNTGSTTNGVHLVAAVATDAQGYQATVAQNVIVSNK